jgi:hypothetical protein
MNNTLGRLTVLFLVVHREEHIEVKIQSMVKEAKAKMAKGDKKGESTVYLCVSVSTKIAADRHS